MIEHCISIAEPYAAAIIAGRKTVEWRSWRLGGAPRTIAIATTKHGGNALPPGHIVGIMRVSACVPYGQQFATRAMMDDAGNVGGYALVIGGAAAVEPVPVRGMPGLYKIDPFEPRYASGPAELIDWFGKDRIAWRDGLASIMVRDELQDQGDMLIHGSGWRIDDEGINA